MISKEQIEAATTGKLHIEFAEISLSRKGAKPDPEPLRGKGYLMQDGEIFRFTFFPNDKAPPTRDYFLRHLMSVGNLIPEDAFFTASCIGLDGIHWTIDDVLPHEDSGPAGYVVHSRVREVRWQRCLPADHGGSRFSAALYLLGKHDFEANEIVKTERTVGNNAPSLSLELSAAVIRDIPGIQMRIEKHETYILLSAWSDQPLPPTFQIAAWQTLEFLLGRVLDCVLASERRDTAFLGVMRPWMNPGLRPFCEPPLSARNVATQPGYWLLFSKVITCLMQGDTTAEVLSSCSSDVISVGNSMLGVQALVRCVAVESLCNEITEKNVEDDKLLHENRSKLLEHLDIGGYLEAFVKRVKGALAAMTGTTAKDTLYRLKDAGFLEEGLITNWSALRNRRTHGRIVTGKTAEDDLNRARAAIGLFYKLVFYIVGYTGPSKDYLLPEQPLIRMVTKEEMDKELAALGIKKPVSPNEDPA